MATTADKVGFYSNNWKYRHGQTDFGIYRSEMSRPKWPVSLWAPWNSCCLYDSYRDAKKQSNILPFGWAESHVKLLGLWFTLSPGQLKAKLAKLRRELLTPSSSGGGGGCKFSKYVKGKKQPWNCKAGFDVARTGVASVGFIGFPSVGKSTLMSRLTGQHSEG